MSLANIPKKRTMKRYGLSGKDRISPRGSIAGLEQHKLSEKSRSKFKTTLSKPNMLEETDNGVLTLVMVVNFKVKNY